MALPTVSKELALVEVESSVLTSSVIHGLAGNFGLCACVLHSNRHSSTEIWRLCSKQRMVIVGPEFGSKQSHETGPRG